MIGKLGVLGFLLVTTFCFTSICGATQEEPENVRSFDSQIEMLIILFENDFSEPGTLTRFGIEEGLYSDIPNVILISIPETEGVRILIGVEDELTEAGKEFILSFTGIPAELADIDQVFIQPQIYATSR